MRKNKPFIYDRKLDLHGLTEEAAFNRLKRFISEACEDDKNSLLIITGRSGVLHVNVPRWLDANPIFNMISSVKTADIQHGGEGALYIKLRKKN